MHILFLCHHYRPEIGAPQRRWDAFVAAWRRAGHAVTVLTALPHYPTGRLLEGCNGWQLLGRRTGEHGETVVRVPFLPIGPRGGSAKLGNQAFVAALSAGVGVGVPRPDVVVSSVPGPATLAAADVLAARWRVPHVLELRDAWPDLLYQGSPDSFRIPAWFGRWMTRRQRRADAVVSVTRSFAEILRARGVHPDRVHHVSNGIDVKDVPALAPPVAHGGPLRVLYLGTHGVSQGLGTAIEAMSRLGPETVSARFVGDGTEKRALQDQAAALDAPVEFLPQVRGAALWQAYEWADTCLVNLADWPAFDHTVPSKLYEIMAVGRHVTGALRGEAARIVVEAGCGSIVAPNDPDALAQQLEATAAHTDVLVTGPAPRAWVEEHANLHTLALQFLRVLERTVPA